MESYNYKISRNRIQIRQEKGLMIMQWNPRYAKQGLHIVEWNPFDTKMA